MGQVGFTTKPDPAGQAGPRSHCIFCGKPNPSATVIWPSWLDLAFPDQPAADEPEQAVSTAEEPDGCGQPLLACADCNSGWITALGEKARQFMEPALTGGQPVSLGLDQIKILAGCACLIAIKSGFLARHCGISPGERAFLRHTGQPTRNWSMFIARLSEPGWSKAVQHHPYRIEFAGNPLTTRSRSRWIKECNTQLFSIGMGPLFLHMFISPSLILMNDFNVSAKSQGLQQLWPPVRRLGMLSVQPVKIPPGLVLTDAHAETIANRFADNLRDRLPRPYAQPV